MHPTEILRRFDDWEWRTRGVTAWPHRVPIEPAFVPLFPGHRLSKAVIDDARRPGLFDRRGAVGQEPFATRVTNRAIIPANVTREIVELEVLLPNDFVVRSGAARSWLASLRSLSEPLSFELLGLPGRVVVQLACGAADVASITGSLASYFPEAKTRKRSDALRQEWKRVAGYGVIRGFGLKDRVFNELRTEADVDIDPLVGIVGELSRVSAEEAGVVQLLIVPALDPWRQELESFALSIDDSDEVLPLIRSKFAEPLFAAVLRIGSIASDEARAAEIARGLTYAVSAALRSEVNEVVPTALGPHSFTAELDDMLDRASHRSGMLLSLPEVLTLFHLPSASVRSERLLRQGQRTKAAPERAKRLGVILGVNEHDEERQVVSLPSEDRLKHTYAIGASGTGKSTLLLSMALQDIAAGNGFAVLDPHGDLIEDILVRIPTARTHDVVIVDPADEAHPVGFNILSAHSELERTLLSSDLVATFRRLSTSFGDQMEAVLGNAILAFLESTEGGTLVDLRRFLIDKRFRARFLETVQDEQVVSYWQEEFALLKGLPHAPILTRLNAFLRSRLIRNMVAQREDNLDMRAIMDGRKILLVKLSHGGIGAESSHLLGSLMVAKIAQAAMSRQDQAAAGRIPFFLYIDEFHHFITPSLIGILSGARKYGLGLTLAHQEMRQLGSRSDELASAVLGNAHTRIVFRVGDQDAKLLSDGFSFFEPNDLQNLGVGEAIARIERPDFDFNLTTSPIQEVSVELGRARRQAALDMSRAGFARPREVVEALLRASRSTVEDDEGVGSTAPRRPSVRKRASSETPVVPPSVEHLPGRGGPLHKYLQSLVKKLAEDRGFSVILEKRVLGGHGHIDVFLERGGLTIGCEISVSTGAAHESRNLSKCLATGVKYAVLLSQNEQTLSEARDHFGKLDDERVRFLSPAAFIGFLDHFDPELMAEKLDPAEAMRADGVHGNSPASGKRMLIAEDAATYLGLGRQALAKMRVVGDSPPFFKIGRRVMYDRDELDAWLATRKRRTTSDPGLK